MNRAELKVALRRALTQLDDYDALRKNPLMVLLPDESHELPGALQRLILHAIEQMRGEGDIAAERRHALLYWRYVEQLDQADVALQMGFSVRHLRREQNNAIEALAERIIGEYASRLAPERSALSAPDSGGALHDEIHWLQESFPADFSDVSVEIERVVESATLLATHHSVQIEMQKSEVSAVAAIPPVILREVLLMLVTTLIPPTASNLLQVKLSEGAQNIGIALTSSALTSHDQYADEVGSAVNIAADLLAPFGGTVAMKPLHGKITVTIPCRTKLPILLIDDNPDTRQLFQRYVTNTNFHLIATPDADHAVELAIENQVRAIVVDIMMPNADGWTVLSHLRHHPATQHIPVATCTILPQQRLSSLLGATLFLQKPVDRSSFIAALDALTGSAVTVPH